MFSYEKKSAERLYSWANNIVFSGVLYNDRSGKGKRPIHKKKERPIVPAVATCSEMPGLSEAPTTSCEKILDGQDEEWLAGTLHCSTSPHWDIRITN